MNRRPGSPQDPRDLRPVTPQEIRVIRAP